ncbi:MAG: phosphoribosylamine--glycine ligase [Oligoflexus sp.]
MKVLLVGSGGREHALAWKLSRSVLVDDLLVWPGNPAMTPFAKPLGLPAAAPLDEVIQKACEQSVDFVVVGPEKPLADGLADRCQQVGLPVFGPVKAAAELEASKAFAKDVMAAAEIPTASYQVVSGEQECRSVAMRSLKEKGGTVIKASGLASGKGVFVCKSEADIEEGLKRLYGGSMAGAAATVVIEDILEGRECSYFCMVGQQGASRLGFAVDFKRLKDGDQGPNTGGMGCYSPVSWLPADAADRVEKEVVAPLLKELERRGIRYQGYLYVGLMWNEKGPSVVEFNVRLGDPEAQVLVVQDDRDWVPMIARQVGIEVDQSLVQDRAPSIQRKAVAVVMASQGYPYGEGEAAPMDLAAETFANQGIDQAVFAASIQENEGRLKTGNGRVLCVVAADTSFQDARKKAYQQVSELAKNWQGVQYRQDIALRMVRESE